eukprot:TRINITY_DN1371_c0_g1_i1.p1 TRINITY_DN1371_c0_g1~~TRINITY_DN1371_c0_g1_i1.p1  ORF type:complete len:291 (+),score=82.41 TRINITY_DN1371_c0_g1_i1:64-873(+)
MKTHLGSGTIRVRVIGAHGLPSKDMNGYADPYCEVSVNHQFVQKTHKIKKTLNPQWNVTFDLPVHNPKTDILHFTIKDWDRFSKDDPLGTGSLVLHDLIRNVEKNISIPLKSVLNNRSAGTVNVGVTAMNFGLDPNLAHGMPMPMPIQHSASHIPPTTYTAPGTTVTTVQSYSTGYGAPAPVYSTPYGAPAYGAPGYSTPGYGAQTTPGYPPGYTTPGYGAPTTPGYGAPSTPGYPPGYGAPAPGYGAPAPGYGAPAPGYGSGYYPPTY